MFAKPPVAGRVKTRLAQSIGDRSAATLAAAMLCDVWSVVSRVPEVIPVLAAAECGSFPVDVPQANFWLQGSGGLGSRISGILIRGLASAPSAIALGADSPLLTPSHLKHALVELQVHDAVVGPSLDGGFYLLGLRTCPPDLLADLPWSSAETLGRTLERLSSKGMSVSRLMPLSDVDTLQDLQFLRQELKTASVGIAPATRRWFAEQDFE